VEVEGDRQEDPREHDAIKAQPQGGLSRDRGVDEDVVIEGVAAEGEDQVPSNERSRATQARGRPGQGGGCSGHPQPGIGIAPRAGHWDRAR
jgi:hypothetical protein